jgi:hypothetical protein
MSVHHIHAQMQPCVRTEWQTFPVLVLRAMLGTLVLSTMTNVLPVPAPTVPHVMTQRHCIQLPQTFLRALVLPALQASCVPSTSMNVLANHVKTGLHAGNHPLALFRLSQIVIIAPVRQDLLVAGADIRFCPRTCIFAETFLVGTVMSI